MTQVISHKNKLIEQQSPPFKGAAIKIMVSKKHSYYDINEFKDTVIDAARLKLKTHPRINL